MLRKQAIKVIKQVADEFGVDAREYSGRGMYGAYCWAIDCGRYEEGEIAERTVQLGRRGAAFDSLGMGSIVYWPSVKFEDEEDK